MASSNPPPSSQPPQRRSIADKMQEAKGYLASIWERSFSVLKAHDPSNPNNLFAIQANVSGSPELQKAIDEIGGGYRDVMLEKAQLKLEMAELTAQKPGFLKRAWSAKTREVIQAIDKKAEPIEQEFCERQKQLCRMNAANFEKLAGLVEASYTAPTRARLGEGVKAQASKDAYVILGKMIQFIVEDFNQAFSRAGIDEFGVPKNIEDPRQMKR